MIPSAEAYADTCGARNDLEDAAANEGNLRGQEGVMVRMFRRLLRGGSKQRVAGAWVF
jgi:hypothetical protein